jgi:hypothetical protein
MKMVRPDIKGRITLGNLAKGVSSFSITIDKKNRIILQPYAEIPAEEKWLFENKLALAKITQGLKDAKEGHVVEKSGFAKYIKDKK